MIIDTHCHLDFDSFEEDLDDVLLNANKNGVEKFIIPGANPKTLKRAIEISQRYENVYFAVGIHPSDARNFSSELFEENLNHPKCVAVGECGLDYYRLPKDEEEIDKEKRIQKEVFFKQIEIAKKYSKPLIVHIRDASRDSKEMLIKYEAKKVGGILHCYNADEELLSLAKDDFYFGIGGVLTFKNAKKIVNVLPKIPLDRVVVETDSPFLTPHPHRGERNEPKYTTLVIEKICEILDKSYDEVARISTKNAKKVFKEI